MMRAIFVLALCTGLAAADTYKMYLNAFIPGYAPNDSRRAFDTLGASQRACGAEPTCGGITREPVRLTKDCGYVLVLKSCACLFVKSCTLPVMCSSKVLYS
jgi:hypothetical protein